MNADQLRPTLVDTVLESDEPIIVCGILYKYVNLGKGWRPRYFVLQDKILRYFKVSGDKLSNVAYITDYCRNNGQVEFIGEMTTRFETDARSQFKPAQQKHIEDLEEKGSVHVEVAKFRASGSDLRKFYVHSGTMTLMLKAESSSDRTAWLRALKSERSAAKTPKTPMTPISLPPAFSTVPATSDHIRDEIRLFTNLLRTNGASEDLLSEAETLLQNIQTRVMEQLYVEREKKIKLLEYVKALESDKQELEKKLLADNHSRISRMLGDPGQEEPQGGIDRASVDESDAEEYQDDNVASSDDEGKAWDGMVADEDEDAFFDCEAADEEGNGDLGTFGSKLKLDFRDEAEAEDGAPRLMPPPPGVEKERRRQRRSKLPDPIEKEKKISLWTIIRDMVGKDLTRVYLPVYFNEPIR